MTLRHPLLGVFWVAYLGALLIQAPAQLAGNLIEHLTAGRLVMSQAVGTLWRGQAEFHTPITSGRHATLGLISWQIDGRALLLAQLKIDAQQIFENQAGQLSLHITPDGIKLKKLHAYLPAKPVATLSPMLAALAPDGRLELESDQFSLKHLASQTTYQGQISVKWQPAVFLEGIPAGSYQLQLGSKDSPRLEGELVTLSGNLNLQGKVQLNEKKELLMDGRVRLIPGIASDRLQPVFRALCGSGQEECLLGKR